MRVSFVDNLILAANQKVADLDVAPHLGLISLAAVLEGSGHDVSIFDPKRCLRDGTLPYGHRIYEAAAASILEQRPDVVGFTTLGCGFIFVLRVAQLLKCARPNLPILLGGPHATILHREIIDRFNFFDAIVRYEAEETLPEVLSSLGSFRFNSIPGITWRSNGIVHATGGAPSIRDLDQLPIPAYGIYPIAKLGLGIMRIEAGRGCPFQCTYCSTASFFQRSFRIKSASRLVKEMDLLHKEYGATLFALSHDLFTVNKKKVLEFCDAVEDRGYRWRVSARADCVDDHLLSRMADAGCDSIYFGIETGSHRLQELLKKRLDLKIVTPTLTEVGRLGMRATISFITGYPEETEGDQEASLDLIGDCLEKGEAGVTPQLHMLLPEPGTELFSRYQTQLMYDGYHNNYNAAAMDKTDLAEIVANPDIFSTYHYYPSLVPRRRNRAVLDAWQMLAGLELSVLRHIIRLYEGKLSKLCLHAADWLARREQKTTEIPCVSEFISDAFGMESKLTSLVRYVLAARGLMDCRDEYASAVGGEEGQFVLSSRARLLECMHDCTALLQKVKSGLHVETLVGGNVGAFVLTESKGTIETFEVGVDVALVIKAFAKPAFVETARDILPSRKKFTAIFGELESRRIIVPLPRSSKSCSLTL